jgi:hypothetical protein
MNERIRLLAEEAEFSKRDLLIQGDNFQRFAELIVRECAEVAYVAEPYHAYDLILKRFELKGEK